jgi:TPR repeat protein
LVLAIGVGCTTGALAAPNEQGIAAFVEGDFAVALVELTPLAERGDVDAAYIVGYMYLEGHGVVASFEEADRFYGLVPEQGIYYNNGLVYLYGLGVPQDYVQAHMWFNLGAGIGSAACARNRVLAEGLMSVPEIAEAQKRATEWAASNGSPH